MADLLSRLQALQEKIRVGVIGIGNIGKGMVYQISTTPGMSCVAIADIDLGRAAQWAEHLNFDYIIVDNLRALHDAIHQGKMAVCRDGNLIAQCDLVDVQVDCSSAITEGAQFALTAIQHHKHVIMMNSEADLIFGPHLLDMAQQEGVVYTSADGDQHTVIKRLINEIKLWGFHTVMAGNIKGYLDRYSNPTAIIPEADKRFMDYKMCTSYTDGTKLCVEMALIANDINGRTIEPGMRGPHVKDIYSIFQYFDFPSLWDGNRPLVDYAFGTYPSGGVFVVGYNDHPHQMETLAWYPCKLGVGPFYVFHRPYHLGHIEGMACIAEAFLDGYAVLQPKYGFVTNVYAYAKKDLEKGELLDGIGGYTAYGLIENCSDNEVHPGLPICLAEDVVLRKAIQKDKKIHLEDVVYPTSDPKFNLFELSNNKSIS